VITSHLGHLDLGSNRSREKENQIQGRGQTQEDPTGGDGRGGLGGNEKKKGLKKKGGGSKTVRGG